jgi:hypothetical protein
MAIPLLPVVALAVTDEPLDLMMVNVTAAFATGAPPTVTLAVMDAVCPRVYVG